MEENKGKKISLGTGICIFIIILLLVALFGMLYYYNYLNKQQKPINNEISANTPTELEEPNTPIKSENPNKPEEPENLEKPNRPTETNISSIVPTRDLYTLLVSTSKYDDSIFFAYIEDGYLYYMVESSEESNQNKNNDINICTYSNMMEHIKKYEGLDNIKRIKTYNYGQIAYWPIAYLITKEGKVYKIDLDSYCNNKLEAIEVERLKNYEVEDIISKIDHDEDTGTTLEVLLKDGSKITVPQ